MEIGVVKSKSKKVLKIIAIIIGAFVLIFIGAGIGSSGAKTQIHDKTMEITQLDKEISREKKELKGLSSDLKEAKGIIAKRDSAQTELTETEAKLKDKKGALEKELAEGRKEIDKQLSDIKDQLADSKSKLDDTNKKLSLATGQLKVASGKPITLSSGHYTVGKDFKSGRYKATNVGRGSNFVVYDKDGDVVVNTILGNGGIGSGDYVFSCEDGYKVETEAPVKLIPIK